MKKFFGLLLAVAMLFTFAFAEGMDMRALFNPNGYTLLKIVDVFLDDADDYVVQGCFGDALPLKEVEIEADGGWVGFDDELVFPLELDKNAVIEMPASIHELENNVSGTIDDLIAFMQQLYDEKITPDFYWEFEMNDAGVLTKLVHCFFPY